MRNYIFPIIKKDKEDKQKEDVRAPLHKRAPYNPVLPEDKKKEKDNQNIDPGVVDFNIDGNIIEIGIRV